MSKQANKRRTSANRELGAVVVSRTGEEVLGEEVGEGGERFWRQGSDIHAHKRRSRRHFSITATATAASACATVGARPVVARRVKHGMEVDEARRGQPPPALTAPHLHHGARQWVKSMPSALTSPRRVYSVRLMRAHDSFPRPSAIHGGEGEKKRTGYLMVNQAREAVEQVLMTPVAREVNALP